MVKGNEALETRLRSVTNRRLGSTSHASLMHAYDTWNLQKLSSCKAACEDAMISTAMKSHTNVFGKGRSARLTRDKQFTSERFE